MKPKRPGKITTAFATVVLLSGPAALGQQPRSLRNLAHPPTHAHNVPLENNGK